MIRIVIVLGCLAGTACSKDITADIEALAERACKCTDAACADKVVDELVTLAEKNKSARGDEERAAKAAQKLGMCVVKAGVDVQKFSEKMQRLQGM
jgi:hypothetical protein